MHQQQPTSMHSPHETARATATRTPLARCCASVRVSRVTLHATGGVIYHIAAFLETLFFAAYLFMSPL
eukprot:scaffold1394_cov109-Isochrysis_galbana.AAC.34